MYLLIKNLHMLFALVSVAGFVLRFSLIRLSAKNETCNKAVASTAFRTVPHINDSLLLAAAIYLAISAQINPMEHTWLAAKIVALLLYIGLGTQVIKQRGSKTRQTLCFVAALFCFAYIAMVAISKQVIPF